MGQRKRHHLVARFLLKRFAAETEGEKSFIWRLSKAAPPKLLSTKDVAVQSNFYGTEEEDLEAALSEVEGHWAAILRRIDAGEALEPLADELWHMVYLMAYRASPIRSAFHSMSESSVFASADADATRALIPQIASRWMPLDEQEIDAIMQSVVRELGASRASEESPGADHAYR